MHCRPSSTSSKSAKSPRQASIQGYWSSRRDKYSIFKSIPEYITTYWNIAKAFSRNLVDIFHQSRKSENLKLILIKLISNQMTYKIQRVDGKIDEITTQSFESYDKAYDLLASIYEDLCCSDADYNERPYYEIIEIQK